jgi:hypothetical protein
MRRPTGQSELELGIRIIRGGQTVKPGKLL